MKRIVLRLGPPALADRVFPRGLWMDIILVFTGAALIAISAQVSILAWPVPITGQVVGVLIVAFGLGLARGTAATAVYLAMGVFGLPVYSNGASGLVHLFGPTGGYLFGFLLAAFVAGLFAARGWDRTPGRAIIATLVSTASIYLVGLPWLAIVGGYSPIETIQLGLLPLLLGALLKSLLIAAIMSFSWYSIMRFDERTMQAQREIDRMREFG